MDFWPRKIEFKEILINSIWSFIAWIIGSIIMIAIIFIIMNYFNVVGEYEKASVEKSQITSFFPIVVSFVTLIWASITMFLTNIMLRVTNPENYKKNIIITWQIAFFNVFLFFFIAPIYIIKWLESYDNIIYIFIIHLFILVLATSIIIEVLNNYRHVLLWIYWSFVWLFFSIIFVLIVFAFLSTWTAKLLSLLILLPFINMFMTFFKQIFEFLYFHYNRYSSLDPLWDIFYKIELEEKEKLREEEEKNIL